MKKITTIAVAGALLALAGTSSAQFAKPEDAIKYRKAAFSVMGAHFGRIGGMVNGQVPFDAAAVASNAQIVESMARLPWAAFGAGTDKGETKAKSETWSDAAKFKSLSDKLTAETAKLSAAAKGGNADAVKAAFGGVAGTCKACHDDFRAK
jgi:cytochrome c556